MEENGKEKRDKKKMVRGKEIRRKLSAKLCSSFIFPFISRSLFLSGVLRNPVSYQLQSIRRNGFFNL